MMKILLVTATAVVLAAPALAQVPSSPPTASPPATTAPAKPAVDFTSADADKSGSLSVAEVKMIDATVTQADFDKADADKSKSLSKAEFDKWHGAAKGDKASSPT
jgi:hypothetical protein